MTPDDRFIRSVAEWLDDQVGPGTPGYLDDVLARTRRTRQRQWWSSLERWLPVDMTLRLAPAPKISLLLVVIGLLIALAAVVVVVGSQTRLPTPFGPAENGAVLYGSNGDIYVMTPDGRQTAIITGQTNDSAPYFAQDGTRFGFLRATGGPGRTAIVLANADGSNVHTVIESVEDLTDAVWSPTGTHIAVASRIDSKLGLWTFDVATGNQTILVSAMRAENLAWTPDGREVIFRGETVGQSPVMFGLYRVAAEGSGLRSIRPPTDNGEHWQNPSLSPDGSKIIYTQWDPYIGGRLWVVDVDGTNLKMLEFDGPLASAYFASWSPDGAQIVYHRWTGETFHLAVAPSGGGHAVNIGPAMPQRGGAARAAFSPDGSKVIARYDADGSTWILDPAGGPGVLLPSSAYLASWQRLAP